MNTYIQLDNLYDKAMISSCLYQSMSVLRRKFSPNQNRSVSCASISEKFARNKCAGFKEVCFVEN